MRPAPLLAMLAVLAAPATGFARDFYVDPATGTAAGDGSAARPWHTLAEVVSAGLFTNGTIAGGDTVFLRDGYHGELVLSGGGNATPIVIAAAPGASPHLRRVQLSNTFGWTLRGLSISPSYAPSYQCVTLAQVQGASSHDIVLEQSELFSQRDASAWTAADWLANGCIGISVAGNHVTIRDNHLSNVRFAISVTGPDVLVAHNVVDGFADDALRGLGDRDVFEYNLARNSHHVDDNHDDLFQSWSTGTDGTAGAGEVTGIVLRGNTLIAYTDPAQPLRGTPQGIGCFDGFYVDWVVENNTVIVDHWHGITFMGARGVRVVNNTVFDRNDVSPGPPWIRIDPHKDGRASSGCVVRNNLTMDLQISAGSTTALDHNVEMSDPLMYVLAPLDAHLRPDSPAINAGVAEFAPMIDAEGFARPYGAGVDLGAFEWHPAGVDAGVSDGAVGLPDGSSAGATDSGAGSDARASDGAVAAPDGSSADSDRGGCRCRAAPARAPGVPAGALGAVAVLALCGVRRRKRGTDASAIVRSRASATSSQ
jgi:hypothetical protein